MPSLGEFAQVDVAAAVAAGEVMVGFLADFFAQRMLIDRQIVLAEVGQPVHRVLAAVAARAAGRAADDEVGLAAVEMQVLGDLAAGLAAADDQDLAGRQLAAVAIG